MKPEPFFEAVEALGASAPIVLMSARGRTFTQVDAIRFAAGGELTILCGHYKDVDQRVADFLVTEEMSLGDFVLSGGEPAALAVIDAMEVEDDFQVATPVTSWLVPSEKLPVAVYC